MIVLIEYSLIGTVRQRTSYIMSAKPSQLINAADEIAAVLLKWGNASHDLLQFVLVQLGELLVQGFNLFFDCVQFFFR